MTMYYRKYIYKYHIYSSFMQNSRLKGTRKAQSENGLKGATNAA